MKKKSRTGGWGLDGGQPSPVRNHMVLWPGEGRQKKVGLYRTLLREGERFVNYSAGGAGWGDPAERDPDTATRDRRNGYVTDRGFAPAPEFRTETVATLRERGK